MMSAQHKTENMFLKIYNLKEIYNPLLFSRFSKDILAFPSQLWDSFPKSPPDIDQYFTHQDWQVPQTKRCFHRLLTLIILTSNSDADVNQYKVVLPRRPGTYRIMG